VLGGNTHDFGHAAPILAVSRVIAAPSQTMPAMAQSPGMNGAPNSPPNLPPPVVPPVKK
jgi:hypothetical protein